MAKLMKYMLVFVLLIPSIHSQEFKNETSRGVGASLFLSPSTVRAIQMKLNEIGFDAGHLTGTRGKETTIALANYQRSVGLEPTGRINLKTLIHLQEDYQIFNEDLILMESSEQDYSPKKQIQRQPANREVLPGPLIQNEVLDRLFCAVDNSY